MKYKAVFLDFYGTLVHEDDEAIAQITQIMSSCSIDKNTPGEIASYWWSEFRSLFENSFGVNFKTQRELETISIKRTLEYFKCTNIDINIDELLFDYWVKPEIFEDTKKFLIENTMPVCIVSNIDRNDIFEAFKYHGMDFENVITSEDAKSYKPRKEIFNLALSKMKLLPQQVLHVGDSLSSDILGAHNCGIDTFWLNRKKRAVSPDCAANYNGESLYDVLKYCM